jgi:hypothetical protein
MTGTAEFDQAVRNFLASVAPGERIETLALATTLLVQLDDPRPIEEARAIVRAEATAWASSGGTRSNRPQRGDAPD